MISCQFENGNNAHLRHVVVDVLIVDEGKTLLVKRSPDLIEGGKWAVVGGYVERDETIFDAAKREVLEESGYEVEILKQLEVIDAPNRPGEDRQNIAFVFVAKPLQKIQNPDSESTDVQWWPLDALPSAENFAFDHLEHIQHYLKSIK